MKNMTLIIIITVVVGILAGYTIFPNELYPLTGNIIDVGLCLLLLFVGIDIGKQKNIIKEIKNMGLSIIVIPLMIALGSILGGAVSSFFLDMTLIETSAVGAGFGWYSISAILLSDYSSELSAISFLSNVLRELIAILIIPFVAKYIGYMEAVAPSGATAMDTTLPIVTKFTDSKTAVLSFISGVILSMLVPILVPLIIGLH